MNRFIVHIKNKVKISFKTIEKAREMRRLLKEHGHENVHIHVKNKE
jgi:hypothetical protein